LKSPELGFDLPDAELSRLLSEQGLRLKPSEARKLRELLGRNPSRAEAVLFDTLWSEHCSYKSSRAALKKFLPVEAPHVILGPGEDAGIVDGDFHGLRLEFGDEGAGAPVAFKR